MLQPRYRKAPAVPIGKWSLICRAWRTSVAAFDRRRQYRLSFYCQVCVAGLDTHCGSRIADLGVGGAFIESRRVLPPGSRTSIAFAIQGRPLATAAEVRYAIPGIGMGVRFLDLDETGQTAIRRLVVNLEARPHATVADRQGARRARVL